MLTNPQTPAGPANPTGPADLELSLTREPAIGSAANLASALTREPAAGLAAAMVSEPVADPAAEARDERVTELVLEQLDFEPGELGEQDLFADRGADSLGMLGVLAALEKEFKVVIEPAELDRMDCLAGVREVLAEFAGW